MSDQLPSGWTMTTLGAVTTPSKERVDPTQVPESRYIGLEHIEAHSMRIIGEGKATDVKSTKSVFHSGDVLYGKLRPYLNKVAYPSFDGVCSTDILVFPKQDNLDPRFLAYFLNQASFAEAAHHGSAGVELPRTSWKNLASIPFPLPSLEQQQLIAALIDQIRAKQHTTTKQLEVARRAIERFRQAVLAAACAGRLTEDWREAHPTPACSASSLIERSRNIAIKTNRQAATIKVTIPDHLTVPETWGWAPLGWLAEIRGGIQKKPDRAPKFHHFPYLRVANVLRSRLDLREIEHFELFEGELDKYRLEPGDLLIVEGNGSMNEVGRSAIWRGEIENCVHQNHIIRVRPIEALPEFLNLFWNSPVGAREVADLAVTTAGLYNLSVGKITVFPIPVPPLEEQAEIVRQVSSMLMLSDSLLTRIGTASQQVERSTQAVLARAFQGGLTTN